MTRSVRSDDRSATLMGFTRSAMGSAASAVSRAAVRLAAVFVALRARFDRVLLRSLSLVSTPARSSQRIPRLPATTSTPTASAIGTIGGLRSSDTTTPRSGRMAASRRV